MSRPASLVLLSGVVALAGCGSEPGSRQTLPESQTVEVTPREVPPPPPASTEVKRGEQLLTAGDPVAAQRAFESAIEADPEDPRAHLDLGIALEMQGDMPGAERSYRRAVALDPDFGEALNNLGLVLLQTRRPVEAVAILERAVGARPQLGDAWVNLALAMEATDRQDEAVDAWKRASELAPRDATVRANLGLAQLAAGDSAAAKETLRAALPLAKNDAAALQAIGNGLRRTGDFEGAVRAMRGAIEAHEGGPTPALLAELALAENAAGQSEAAEATLARALELDPDYATGHYLLAGLLASREAYDEAIEHYRAVIRIDPRGPHADKAKERLRAARKAKR